MKVNYKEYLVVTVCPMCGQYHEVGVNETDYWDWDDGMNVQDAFPYLSANEREMLISGICPECWDRMFPPEEDEDEDMEDWERDLEMMQAWERQCERDVEEMLRGEE